MIMIVVIMMILVVCGAVVHDAPQTTGLGSLGGMLILGVRG